VYNPKYYQTEIQKSLNTRVLQVVLLTKTTTLFAEEEFLTTLKKTPINTILKEKSFGLQVRVC